MSEKRSQVAPFLAMRFVSLGKPHPAIFEEAVRRAGTRHVVMIGDRLETDIRGANDFGIASALITAGGAVAASVPSHGPQPTCLLSSIRLE